MSDGDEQDNVQADRQDQAVANGQNDSASGEWTLATPRRRDQSAPGEQDYHHPRHGHDEEAHTEGSGGLQHHEATHPERDGHALASAAQAVGAPEQADERESGHRPGPEHGHEHEAGEHGHEHHTGFVHAFRERAISLRSMERPLRLITGLAIAQLVVVAVLIAVHNLPLPGFSTAIPVYVDSGHLVQMPLLIFLVSMLFLVLAWSYLLSGALHAHPVVRLIGLATVTWAMLDVRDVAVAAGYGLPATGVLVAIWLVGLGTWALDWRARRAGGQQRDHRRRLRLLTFGLIFLLIAAFYVITWWGVRVLGAMLFPSAVTVQLMSLQYALIPLLFLAGTDFAEWGQVTGERVSEVAGRVGMRSRPPLLLAALTGLAAVGILVYQAFQFRHETWHQLLLGAVMLGLLALLVVGMRVRRALPRHVPYAALAIGAVVYVGVGEGIATGDTLLQARTALPKPFAVTTYTQYRHDRLEPHFSMQYPATWEVLTVSDKGPKQVLLIGFNGLHAAFPALLWVLSTSVAGEKNLTKMRQDWLRDFYQQKGWAVHAVPAGRRGPWLVTAVMLVSTKGGRLQSAIWERRVGDRLWLLMSEAPPNSFKRVLPIFTTMVDSWTPSVAPVAAATGAEKATAEASAGDPLLADLTIFWLLVAVGGAAALLIGARRRRTGVSSGALAAGALFLVVAGLLIVFSGYPQLRLVYGNVFGLLPPGQKIGLVGVQVAVAAGTLLVLAWLAVTRRLSRRFIQPLALLLTLNIGLQIVAWVFDLYSSAMDLGGRFTVAQAVVILLALLWDMTMSGETITNVQGRIFPRHARVLLFCGYIMLVAANILYFSTLQVQATGVALESQFESETWPQLGVLFLGVPLLLTLFVLGLSHWLRQPGRALEVESEPHEHGGADEDVTLPRPHEPPSGVAADPAGDGGAHPSPRLVTPA